MHLNGSTYEGNWTNNFQNGYGIETFPDGSIYKGNFEMGKKKGKGLFQWKNGASYEGEFDNDMLNGKGLYIFPDGKKYNGDWKNNKMDGKGEFTWPNGRIYVGEYKDGKIWNGKGYDINGNIVYEIKDGKGYVKLYTDYGSYCHFLGEYKNGEANGLGKSFWQGKSTPLYKEFEREYKDGEEYEGKRYKYNQ